MAQIFLNPRHHERLASLGLISPGAFAALQGVIVTGHPDRHVLRVSLGSERAFLKREHRIRWRDRFRAALAGWGWVTKSLREARVLEALRLAGIPVPDWLATGIDGTGKAFLLLEDLPGFVDLREFLKLQSDQVLRRQVAVRLGTTLAALHEAGFDHPDLYAKHVLVHPETLKIRLLDWQRTRRRRRVPLADRCRDLAALEATLDQKLARSSERLILLRAYAKAWGLAGTATRGLAQEILARSRSLLRKRHLRAERALPAPAPGQGILWLQGEALCVTEDFWEDLEGKIPGWLPLPEVSDFSNCRIQVRLPGGGRGVLVRRTHTWPLAWVASLIRSRRLLAPEIRRAGEMFQRQRRGESGPRLLAFGQRTPWPWRIEAFLLTEERQEP